MWRKLPFPSLRIITKLMLLNVTKVKTMVNIQNKYTKFGSSLNYGLQ